MRRKACAVVVVTALTLCGSSRASEPTIDTATPITPGVPTAQTSPVVVSEAAGGGWFPALPPSRPCVRQDVDGLWRLKNVYESPAGAELSDFSTQPYQYILFQRDDTYRTYKSSWEERSDGVVVDLLMGVVPSSLQQYLVHASGMIFFYTDGVASATQACFIVVTGQDVFLSGQMLLMPPEGQSASRLVKVYERSAASRQPRGGARTVDGQEVDNYSAQPNKKRPRKPRKKRRNKEQ